MTYSKDKLFAEISRDEGRKNLPYRDSLGIWTGGVGHNLEAHGVPVEMLVEIINRAGGLTEDEIDRLLQSDIEDAEMTVSSLFPAWRQLQDARQRVLLNMAFNMGHSVFSTFKKFWKALAAGDIPEVGRQMWDSRWRVQVGVRAERLRKMLEEGK